MAEDIVIWQVRLGGGEEVLRSLFGHRSSAAVVCFWGRRIEEGRSAKKEVRFFKLPHTSRWTRGHKSYSKPRVRLGGTYE